MTQTTTMTIRLDKKTEAELVKVAAYEKRSKSFLAAEAVQQYLDIKQAQIEGIKQAISSIEINGGIPHSEVKSWSIPGVLKVNFPCQYQSSVS